MKYLVRAFLVATCVGIALGIVQPLAASSWPIQGRITLEPALPGISLSADAERACERLRPAWRCAAGTFLFYSCGQSGQVLFDVSNKHLQAIAGSLSALSSVDNIVSWDATSQALLAFLGGVTGGYHFKDLKALPAMARMKAVARIIVGALSGYSLGKVLGGHLRYRCEGRDVQRFIRDDKQWPFIEHEFIGRLLQEATRLCEHSQHTTNILRPLAGTPSGYRPNSSSPRSIETPNLDLHGGIFPAPDEAYYRAEEHRRLGDDRRKLDKLSLPAGALSYYYSVSDIQTISEAEVLCAYG